MAQEPNGTTPSPDPSGRRTGDGDGRDTRDIVRLVVLVVGLILLVAFVIGNSNSVDVNFLFFSHRSSLIWVILISALLGVVIDRLVILVNKRRKARK